MRRSRRQTSQLDYQALHTSGKRLFKESSEVNVTELSGLFENFTLEDTTMDDLQTQVETIADDIDDFIDENPVNQMSQSTDNLIASLEKINQLRSLFRCKNKELQRSSDDYESKYGQVFETKMKIIKDFIRDVNDARHKLRIQDYVLD